MTVKNKTQLSFPLIGFFDSLDQPPALHSHSFLHVTLTLSIINILDSHHLLASNSFLNFELLEGRDQSFIHSSLLPRSHCSNVIESGLTSSHMQHILYFIHYLHGIGLLFSFLPGSFLVTVFEGICIRKEYSTKLRYMCFYPYLLKANIFIQFHLLWGYWDILQLRCTIVCYPFIACRVFEFLAIMNCHEQVFV